MKIQTIQFKTKKEHRVCVNLSPKHFEFLKRIAHTQFNNDISKTILYLLSKYLRYLFLIKKIDTKRTLTIDYQPPTKEYKRYWININPTYWGDLYNLRFALGYSMSFLLRIMLDWEMEENHEPNIDVLIPKPILNQSTQRSTNLRLLQNYAQEVRIFHRSRWVYMQLKGYD